MGKPLKGFEALAQLKEDPNFGKTPIVGKSNRQRKLDSSVIEQVKSGVFYPEKYQADTVDRKDRTPLFWAASLGHANLLAPLVEAGEKLERANNDGATPFLIAVGSGQIASATKLYELGANINHQNTKKQQTGLQLAIANKNEEMVKLLMSFEGILIQVPDFEGETAIDYLESIQNPELKARLMKLVLKDLL